MPENPSDLATAIAAIDDCIARFQAHGTRKRGRARCIVDSLPPVTPAPPAYACADCRDDGMVKVQRESGKYGLPGWRYDLEPCHCQHQRIAEQRAQRIRSASNLTRQMDGMTFDSYDRAWDARAYDAAHAFALALADGGEPEWPFLMLSGTYGSGKTHLLAAIAHEAMRSGRQPVFVVVPRLLDWLRAGYDKSDAVAQLAFQQRLDGICTADVLLLDDLGAEQETTWTSDKLFQIINDRYAQRLPTVISSNLDADQMEPRIADRLWDQTVCQQIYTVEKSYRRRGAQS